MTLEKGTKEYEEISDYLIMACSEARAGYQKDIYGVISKNGVRLSGENEKGFKDKISA